MRPIGFSTGALALGDFKRALAIMRASPASAVELSALRSAELRPLVEIAGQLDLSQYSHVSVHAPSGYDTAEEAEVVERLSLLTARGWPVVVHPDAIVRFDLWQRFGSMLLIENMDKRKRIGRSAAELAAVFSALPEARLCFDIAHARQFDSSMTEAYLILRRFNDRLAQVHISEVGTRSTHVRISPAAMRDFQEVAGLMPDDVPVILETPVGPADLAVEIEVALEALSSPALTGWRHDARRADLRVTADARAAPLPSPSPR
jgi:hypothetical protein